MRIPNKRTMHPQRPFPRELQQQDVVHRQQPGRAKSLMPLGGLPSDVLLDSKGDLLSPEREGV
jgi:hypothetical protein